MRGFGHDGPARVALAEDQAGGGHFSFLMKMAGYLSSAKNRPSGSERFNTLDRA